MNLDRIGVLKVAYGFWLFFEPIVKIAFYILIVIVLTVYYFLKGILAASH